MSLLLRFLQGSAEDRAGDGPRLILADWLEESGDPSMTARAELIRLQCRLLRETMDWKERRVLQEREQELVQTYSPIWLGPLENDFAWYHYDRGLLLATIPGRRFMQKGFAEKLAAQADHALLLQLHLTHLNGKANSLARSRSLPLLVGLELRGNRLVDVEIAKLVTSPGLENLVHLDLRNNLLTDASLYQLATSPNLPCLVSLDLRHNAIHGGIEALGPAMSFGKFKHSPLGKRIRWLDLFGNPAYHRMTREDLFHFRPELKYSNRLMNTLGMEFARIPAGSFLMGSDHFDSSHREDEGPIHPIYISRSFHMGIYPVTQNDYESLLGINPAAFRLSTGESLSWNPVEHVNWQDAVDFCDRLTALPEEQAAMRRYRLPTEAEWEYACRAGTQTPFSSPNPPNAIDCNYDGQFPIGAGGVGPYLKRTSPVGCYPPNGWGLYDMHGNVWEWCQDWYHPQYYKQASKMDPQGPSEGERRVARGGCWDCVGSYCRAAHRLGDDPQTRDSFNGFRVVCEVGR